MMVAGVGMGEILRKINELVEITGDNTVILHFEESLGGQTVTPGINADINNWLAIGELLDAPEIMNVAANTGLRHGITA